MNKAQTCKTMLVAALASGACVTGLHAQSSDALLHKLVQKGILTDKEAKDIAAEASQTNQPPAASKWRIDNAIKYVNLYGDVRLRYEYRGAENAPGTGLSGNAYYKERFRYAVRLGIRGDLLDNFYYGLRVETSTNPRSPWNTFGQYSGNNANNAGGGTPSDKSNAGINLGQVYLGWRPADGFEMTIGKMPNPLYTTPLVWDPDINPEGAVEKFKLSLPRADLFANFAQFVYQNTSPGQDWPTSDTFILASQLGATLPLTKDLSLKVAPVLYLYSGNGVSVGSSGLGGVYTGQGDNTGLNHDGSVPYNQSGLNDLVVLEVPAEVNFKVGQYNARIFGDFAYNFQGRDRAEQAFLNSNKGGGTTPLAQAYTDQNKAYQVGLGFGNLGLVYGSTSKKNTWEARAYWQHLEQYALDVNLIDSDFFEGRANLQGLFSAFAYSFTDNIIGTVRYGYAQRLNDKLGTGGYNFDMPLLNPIRNYHLVQFDLTWRF